MSRLAALFATNREQNANALITFITAGDPTISATLPQMRALVKGGTDIIELGVPFSDPEADGPTIQRSSERALANGTTLSQVLDVVSMFRKENRVTPVVLMGYLNPILAIGYDRFVERATQAGVDGVIVVNLPVEEAGELQTALQASDIDLIPLVAPTTKISRVREITERASGFLYYISVKGITGADHLLVEEVREHVEAIRSATHLPIAVGFGVKTPAIASQVAKIADGVVVGSALVETIGAYDSIERMVEVLADQVRALRVGVGNI